MSGSAHEYVMGNIVSPDGTTMLSGHTERIKTYTSGYTGITLEVTSYRYATYTGTYSYPENKYLDKYSFGISVTQIIRSKLGDAVKEVTGISSSRWYKDYSYVPSNEDSWFKRGGDYSNMMNAGIFCSYNSELNYSGAASDNVSSRVVILIP